MARKLAREEAIFCGYSAGTVMQGLMQLKDKFKKDDVVVVILHDHGSRYLAKIYNDDWMREAGFLDKPSMGTVADLMRVMHPNGAPAVIMAKQTDKVSAVIDLMSGKGISQVPVADPAGWIKGVATEGAILNALYTGRVKSSDTIEALVDASVEFVTPDDPVEKVSRLVTSGKTPLVNDPHQHGKILGIVTKIDLLTYLGHRSV
jgi:cystathionine beta-synthase